MKDKKVYSDRIFVSKEDNEEFEKLYEIKESKVYDLKEVAKMMVIGQALENPAFKKKH